MKSKVTLTIEKDLIEEAKLYAKSKGISLSKLIESYLRILTIEKKNSYKLSSEIKALKGAIKLPNNFNYKNELGSLLDID